MTATLTDDDLAVAFREDLHARCTHYRRSTRFRECNWSVSGYCSACGRPRPTLDQVSDRMRRGALEASPVVRSLDGLAREFDQAAARYGSDEGSQNSLLCSEAARAAAQLRLVAQFVRNGTYGQAHGALWVRSARNISRAMRDGAR